MVRRERERKGPWAKAFIVVSMGGMGEAGETDLGLASVRNVSRLWDVGAVLNFLVHGPGGN